MAKNPNTKNLFEKTPSMPITDFLNEISQAMQELRDEKKRTARRLAPDFSVFDMTRSDEMALSKCFAGLLNPEGGHGQGRLFLDKFLEKICGKRATWATGNCTVTLEKQANGQRRIDIYLDFGSAGGVIGIENKPWAGDQPNQLSDYADYIKNKVTGKNKWLLLYFSNHEPSEESIKPDELEKIKESGNFIYVNYDQVIAWLDECLSETCSIKVQIFIEDLIQFIRLKINQELTVAETQEIVKTIIKYNKLKEFFDVLSVANDLKDLLLTELKNNLNINQNKYEFEFNDVLSNKKWLTNKYGEIKTKISTNNIYIGFSFDKNNLDNLVFGIKKADWKIEKSDKWKKLNECLQNKYNYGKSSDNWPWYASINQSKLFEKDVENWSNNPIPWQMIQSGEMAGKMIKLVYEIYETLKEFPELNTITNSSSVD